MNLEDSSVLARSCFPPRSGGQTRFALATAATRYAAPTQGLSSEETCRIASLRRSDSGWAVGATGLAVTDRASVTPGKPLGRVG